MKIQLNLPKCSVPVWECVWEDESALIAEAMNAPRVRYVFLTGDQLNYFANKRGSGVSNWVFCGLGGLAVNITQKQALALLKENKRNEVNIWGLSLPDPPDEIEPEEESDSCAQCAGTGIGQHGDPDTSKCTACGGRGYFVESEAPERDWYQEAKDERIERDFQEAIED